MNRSLSQLGRQCLDIWKQLGLNQRISVVLAGSVVLIFMGSLAFWSSKVDYALLYGGLNDAEAGRITTVLDEMKIPYRIGQGGGAVHVPKAQVHTARMQLASKGLPQGEGVGFEIFDKPNFGISDFVQRANYIRAVQGELSRTISQLDEVESARVMIVQPENRLLVDRERKATASVFVRTKARSSLPNTAVEAIQFLVANSVEGLRSSQVSVVDNRGRVLSQDHDTDSIVGLSSAQLAARRSVEDYLAKKTESMLEAVLGPGQAVVRVSAEINYDSMTRTEETFDPDSAVIKTETTDDETTETSDGDTGGGAPGIVSNLGLYTNSPAGASATTSKIKRKTTSNEYEISKISSSLTQIAGGLKRVSAAVFVAPRYEGAGADRKVVVRTPEELEKLRRIVQSALGVQVQSDGTSAGEITLEEMPFSDPTGEWFEEGGFQDQNQFLWDHVVNGGYMALALGLVVIFWRLLKKTPFESVPAGLSAQGAASSRRPAGNGHSHYSLDTVDEEENPDAATSVPSVEVFNRLVQENPENLTQAIQTWLDQGSPTPTNRS